MSYKRGPSPEMTIVIPTVRFSQDLVSCVNSVYRSLNYSKITNNFELLVVTHEQNNDEISNWSHNKQYLTVLTEGGKAPLSTARARNIGIQRAKHGITCFIDSDCTARQDWASQIINAFNKTSDNPDLAAIQGNHWQYSGSEMSRFLRAYQDYRRLHAVEHLFIEGCHTLTDRLDGRNFAIKTDIASKILFDETLDREQDREFGARLSENGHKIAFFPDIVVYHKPITPLQLFKKQFYYGVGAAQWRETNLEDELRRYFTEKIKDLCRGEINADVFLITMLNNTTYELGKLYNYYKKTIIKPRVLETNR